jgi:hypothetical protein
MKRLKLLVCAMMALPMVVQANALSVTNEENGSEGEPVAISDDGLVTVSGQVYYIAEADVDNIYGIRTGVKNSTLTLSDNSVIQADENGYFSFQCERDEAISFSVSCPYDEEKQHYYYIPSKTYELTPGANTQYNIQVVKTDNADGSPHMVRVHGCIYPKANSSSPVANVVVLYKCSLENAQQISYSLTTSTDGIFDFVDENGDGLLVGNLYYRVFVKDSELNRYGSVVNSNFYVKDGTDATTRETTPNELQRNYELVKYGTFNMDMLDVYDRSKALTESGYAPPSITVDMDFYDWEDNKVEEVNAPYSQAQLVAAAFSGSLNGDYYGYYVHAKSRGYYQTELSKDGAPGKQFLYVDNMDHLQVYLQKEQTTGNVIDPIPSTKNPSHCIKVSFPGHSLTYNETGATIYLKYGYAFSEAPGNVTGSDGTQAQLRTASAENHDDIPMYAIQAYDENGNGYINVLFDHDNGAPYTLLDKTNYSLVMPELTVVIDSYIYDYDLSYNIPVKVGVFAMDTEPMSTLVDVYTTSGLCVKHGIEESMLNDLPNGLYIVRSATSAYKYLKR